MKTVVPAVVPQPHGGGLYTGGVPGNHGGPGRPPSVLRERLRGSFEQRVPVLEGIADDQKADPQDRIRAMDVMGKYGIGTLKELSLDEVRERLRQTLQVIRQELSREVADTITERLRVVWSGR